MPQVEQTRENYQSDVDRLRINSRAKHLILGDYLGPWAGILGKCHKWLNYFDCFAGPGEYRWKDEIVEGSPIISIREFTQLINSPWPNKPSRIKLVFLESDENQRKKLKTAIAAIQDKPSVLDITVIPAESEKAINNLLEKIESLAPSFFFIDPYGHPFSLSLMEKIMKLKKAEIVVNFMYYQIIRDIDNPTQKGRCDRLFYPDDPAELDLKTKDKYDPNKMLDYLQRRIGSRYYIPFRVNFGSDEKVPSKRPKYYLIHYSNNFRAFELMLSIMWKHSDDARPLEVSDGQPFLFPIKSIDDLQRKLLAKYDGTGTRIAFKELVENNWIWYYLEKHYRGVLKNLEGEKIKIERITSKKSGLSGFDIVAFF